jgi:hypothetical protein
MYLVVSKWEIRPGMEDEFAERSRRVRGVMAHVPGVEMIHGFKNEAGELVSIIGYTDEATHHHIVFDPLGPFVAAVERERLEEVATWISSEKGEETPS